MRAGCTWPACSILPPGTWWAGRWAPTTTPGWSPVPWTRRWPAAAAAGWTPRSSILIAAPNTPRRPAVPPATGWGCANRWAAPAPAWTTPSPSRSSPPSRSSWSTAAPIAPELRPGPRSSAGSPGTTSVGCTRPTTTCRRWSGNSGTVTITRYRHPWPHSHGVRPAGEVQVACPGDTRRTSGKPLSACASRRSWAARSGTLPQNTITADTAQEQQARRRTHATTAARLAGSSSGPGVQLQSPARALAECPAQLRAGGEPDCGRGLGGQLLSTRRRRADLRGDAAPREGVGTGGREPRDIAVDAQVAARPRLFRGHLSRAGQVAGGGQSDDNRALAGAVVVQGDHRPAVVDRHLGDPPADRQQLHAGHQRRRGD